MSIHTSPVNVHPPTRLPTIHSSSSFSNCLTADVSKCCVTACLVRAWRGNRLCVCQTSIEIMTALDYFRSRFPSIAHTQHMYNQVITVNPTTWCGGKRGVRLSHLNECEVHRSLFSSFFLPTFLSRWFHHHRHRHRLLKFNVLTYSLQININPHLR